MLGKMLETKIDVREFGPCRFSGTCTRSIVQGFWLSLESYVMGSNSIGMEW